MTDASYSEEWKQIAEAITKEPDQSKLAQLVKELCQALDANRTKQDLQSTS